MAEFDEGILELSHAEELLVFGYLLKANSLAPLRIQARGKE